MRMICLSGWEKISYFDDIERKTENVNLIIKQKS